MKPAALATCGRKHLFQRRPEAHCAVADRQPWPCLQTALFQVEQKLQPRRFRLAIPIADRHTLFAPVRFHTDDDQQALPIGVLAAQPRVNAVDPPIDVARLRQVTRAPRGMFVGPLRLQPTHDIRRQALGVIAQQHAQRFAHVARRDALQIQPRQRCAHARRLPHVWRHDRRIETSRPIPIDHVPSAPSPQSARRPSTPRVQASSRCAPRRVARVTS